MTAFASSTHSSDTDFLSVAGSSYVTPPTISDLLHHYANKDLAAIAAMFADEMTRRDWNPAVVGKAAALHEMAKNFQAVQSIEIEALHVYNNIDAVAGELRIVIDGALELHVVDALTFAVDGKITAIRAYLGRGDD